jgi:hypothetical protein
MVDKTRNIAVIALIFGLIAIGSITNICNNCSNINGNNTNLLDNITPTFSNWTQGPGTNADLVNESDNTLTTPGIASVISESTIIYDLGSIKRVLIHSHIDAASNGQIDVSVDGINYLQAGAFTFTNHITYAGNVRYIKFSDGFNGNTYNIIGIRAYLL